MLVNPVARMTWRNPPVHPLGQEVFHPIFILHPSPFTLHPSPFILHPSPLTLHPCASSLALRLCVLYVHLVMKRKTHRHSSRGFLFGSFSFVGNGGNVDNFAPRALCRVSFHAATWEDRAGGGGVLRPGTCEKPAAKICPASCPCGFRKDRTLSRGSARIWQDGSGNRIQPGGLYHEQ